MRKQSALLASTAAVFLLANPGQETWAKGNPLPGSDLMSLPLESLMTMEVQSASKFRQPIADAPSAVSVITAREIRTFGWRTLADVLNSLPGIHLTNDRTYTYLGTRGFLRAGDYTPRILVMIDGHRTNDPLYDQAMLGQEFALDVDLIERVEYVPGPGSAIYGSNAFFGVVNVITKRGRDINGVQVSAEAGSAGMGRGRVTAGGVSENNVEWLLSATGHDSDGKDLRFPQFPGQVARGLDYERAQSAFAKLSAGPVKLSFAHVERDKGMPTAVYSQVFNDPRAKTVDESTFVNLTYANAVSDKTEFSGRLYYSQYRYRGDYVYADGGGRIMNFDRSSADWWGGEAKLVTTRFDNHKLVTGVEYNRINVDYRNFDPNPFFESFALHKNNYRVGIYAQDEWTLRPDWLLSVGMRYDRNSVLKDSDQVSPRLGLIVKFTPQTTGKLLYGNAYRMPNLYELYYNDIGNGNTQKPSPNLRAENIRSSEMVLEHQWPSGSRLRLSAYLNKVRDMITLQNEWDPFFGKDMLILRNEAHATAKGLEAEAQHEWQNGLRLRGSLSWQRATSDETGRLLPNAPKYLGKLNLSTPFYDNRWRAGLEVQHVSRRNTLPEYGTRVGGYSLTNLTLTSDRLLKGLDVSASVYNLFNRRYAMPVGSEFNQDGLARDFDAISGDGRTFRVKLTYNF